LRGRRAKHKHRFKLCNHLEGRLKGTAVNPPDFQTSRRGHVLRRAEGARILYLNTEESPALMQVMAARWRAARRARLRRQNKEVQHTNSRPDDIFERGGIETDSTSGWKRGSGKSLRALQFQRPRTGPRLLTEHRGPAFASSETETVMCRTPKFELPSCSAQRYPGVNT
jgi:hypothetical protein